MSDDHLTFYIAKTSPGCHSLSLDCQEFREVFLKNRYQQVNDPADALFIMIGACVVSSINEDQTIDLIKKMKIHKDRGASLIISGCLTDHLKSRIGGIVDCLYFSIADIENFRDHFGFSNTSDTGKMSVDIKSIESMNEMLKRWQILHGILRGIWKAFNKISPKAGLMLGRLLNTTYAYSPRSYFLKCSRGCSSFCTYCIIRDAAQGGRLKSRPFDAIIYETREALKAGHNHFVLVADELSSYGLDQGSHKFADLLEAIMAQGDSFTVELPNLQPKYIIPDLDRFIGVLSDRVRCIELDFQSGSDRILKLMNRGYTKEEFLLVANSILKKAPSISLRADVIVGFPSEEEEDFKETIDVLHKIPFERMNINSFEERPGAPALRISGQIPLEIRKERQNKVRRILYQKQIRRWMAGFAGQDVIF